MTTKLTSDVAGNNLIFQFSKGPESITKTLDRSIDLFDIPFQTKNYIDDFVSVKVTFSLDGFFNESDGTIATGQGGGTVQQMKDALEDIAMPASDGSQATMYFQSNFESATRIQQVQIQRVTTTVSGRDPLRVKYMVELVGGERLI